MSLITCQELASCSFGLNGLCPARMICVQHVVFRHRWRLFTLLQPLSAPLVSLQTASWCYDPYCQEPFGVSLWGAVWEESGEVSHWGEGSGVSSGCVSRAGGECCYRTAVRFIHVNMSVHSEGRQQNSIDQSSQSWLQKLCMACWFLEPKVKMWLLFRLTSTVLRCLSSYSTLHIILQERPVADKQ